MWQIMKALDHRGEIQTIKSRKNSPAHALQLKYQNYCGRWDGKKKKKKGSESWAYWNGYTLYNQKAHQSIMFNKNITPY